MTHYGDSLARAKAIIELFLDANDDVEHGEATREVFLQEAQQQADAFLRGQPLPDLTITWHGPDDEMPNWYSVLKNE
jgi:hypothetical protein